MNLDPQILLIAAVLVVGVLHTMVPDHWVPITLIARQRGWTRAETVRAALMAGTGHVVSTLAIALVFWVAGVAVAKEFGEFIDTAASIALIALGGWIAISAFRELRAEDRGQAHGHGHAHGHSHDFSYLLGAGEVHGPELQRVETRDGELLLSIYESGVPPRFRLTGGAARAITVETIRPDGSRQRFPMVEHGTHWESRDEIPEPHGFDVTITLERDGAPAQSYTTTFAEHEHGHGHDHGHDHAHGHDHGHDHMDQAAGDVAVLERHAHVHRHPAGPVHSHLHAHTAADSHAVTADTDGVPPLHEHQHRTQFRTALLLILGSSPMVEGIPAFFAAGKYGPGLIAIMSIVFAISTIATYVALCVASTEGLGRLRFGPIERYGEVLSGAFIALVGVVFWIWPVI